jgi:thymidylate synthase
MYQMTAYDDALLAILKRGVWKSSKRTGVRTLSITGIQSRYPLAGAFPVMTRRKVWPKSVFAELLWFISGSTNNRDLQALGCDFWTPWESREFEAKNGYAEGSFGPVYGFQLRHFGGAYGNGVGGLRGTQDRRTPGDVAPGYYGAGGFDQLADLMRRLRADPTDRRLIISLWNPHQTDRMRLPPCHLYYQVTVDDAGRLTGFLNQRSCDFPVGVPANIQFYAALTCMVAQQAGFEPHELVHSTVDSHIYEDQVAAVEAYLATGPVPSPRLVLNRAADIFSYKVEDFALEDFKSGPKIDIPVAV